MTAPTAEAPAAVLKLAAAVPAVGLAPAPPSMLPPLVAELEYASTSFLEPEAFFVSWQGVVTLTYRGFTPALIELKQRITAAHPSLPPENPGSRWPKSSLGCLRDGQRLTPEQLDCLVQICREESAALKQLQQQQPQQQLGGPDITGPGNEAAAAAQGAEFEGPGIRMAVDSAAVVLFECRSLERLLTCQPILFRGGIDGSPPHVEELSRVAGIVAEQEAPDYWFAASKDGHRESHYRGAHLGATLMHPLLPEPWEHEAFEEDHAGDRKSVV